MNWRFWQHNIPSLGTKPEPWGPVGSGYHFESELEEAKGKKERLSLGQIGRAAVWRQLDDLFLSRGEVSSAILSGAGYVVAGGMLLEARKSKTAGKGGRSDEARQLCDQFCRDMKIMNVIHEASILALLHGSVLLQKNLVAGRLGGLRVFPWQDCLEPEERLQDTNEVTKWRQLSRRTGAVQDHFNGDEIVHVPIPPLDDDGFGTGLVGPLMNLIQMRTSIDADSKGYAHLTALPKELFMAGSLEQPVSKEQQTALYNYVKQWKAGEAYVSNYPITYKAAGVGDVESQIFTDLMKNTQERVVDGMMIPPISYLRNATEASARAMITHVRIALVQPLQQVWQAKLESEVFEPLLVGEGIDDPEVVPNVVFLPPTDIEVSERWKRIIMAKQAGVITLEEARAMLDIKEIEGVPPPTQPPSAKQQEPPSEPSQSPAEAPAPTQQAAVPPQRTMKQPKGGAASQ